MNGQELTYNFPWKRKEYEGSWNKQLLNILWYDFRIHFHVYDISFVAPWLDSGIQEQIIYHQLAVFDRRGEGILTTC